MENTPFDITAVDQADSATTDEGLSSVAELAQKQVEYEDKIANLEAELKQLNKEYNVLREKTLPDAIAATGLASIQLINGMKIEVQDQYRLGIPKDPTKRRQCFDYLEQLGLGNIIKNEVSVSFGNESQEDARELVTKLKEEGFLHAANAEKVHSQTLNAAMRREFESRNEDGVFNIDQDKFTGFVGQRSKVIKS